MNIILTKDEAVFLKRYMERQTFCKQALYQVEFKDLKKKEQLYNEYKFLEDLSLKIKNQVDRKVKL